MAPTRWTPNASIVGLPASVIVDSLEAACIALRSNSDVSYHLFKGLELSDLTAVQSLFGGVIFRRCILRRCNFSRSDFEGARFEQCEFYETDWTSTDVRSTQFVECLFEIAAFDDAHIADNFFVRCTLRDVSFTRSTLLANSFDGGVLTHIHNQAATILHTEFRAISFDDVKFANCTALYSIFDACEFRDFTINCDSLGLTFGLSPTDLGAIKLAFLGRDEEYPAEVALADAIIESFRTRRWPLHFAIARLCYSNIPRADAWHQVLAVLIEQIESRRGGTVDEVQFVVRVARRGADRQRLPFAAVIHAFDRLNHVAFANDDLTAEERAAELLLGELKLLLARMQEQLLIAIAPVLELPLDQTVVAEFVFADRPASAPSPFLVQLATLHGAEVQLLPDRAGSWIQPLQVAGEGLLGILVGLYLLEGCLIQLTRLRARTQVLVASALPAAYLEAAQSTNQEIPPIVRTALRGVFENYISGRLQAPPRDAGLGSGELEEIRLLESDGSPSTSKKKHKR